MATIEERNGKNGLTYQVKIRIKGHPQVTETFKRKTDAKRWAAQTETEIRQGRYFPKSEARKRTFEELIKRYKETVLKKHYPEYQWKYVNLILDWWCARLGKRFLCDVTAIILTEYRDKLASEPTPHGKILAPATVNKYLAFLSQVFTVAVRDWGWLEDNPMRNVKGYTLKNQRTRFLSDNERARLLKVCSESPCAYLYPVILIALTTGGRKSEIMFLEWKYVDFERRRLHFIDTKNGESRSVPMTQGVYEQLKKLRAVPRIDTDYIFPRKDGLAPLEIKKHYQKAFKDAELQDFKFHDLRHTAASYLAMSGATLVELSQILGHKTIQMVKRYAHLCENHTASIVDKMSKKFIEC